MGKVAVASDVVQEVKEILTFQRRCLLWFLEELRWFFRVILAAIDRFYWENGFSRAASLAYTTLFALVPVSALALGILAWFRFFDHTVEAPPSKPTEQISVEPGPIAAPMIKSRPPVTEKEVREFVFRQFVPRTAFNDEVLNKLQEFSQAVVSVNAVMVVFLLITSLLLINSVEYALNEIWQVYEPRTIAHRIAIFCAIIVIVPVLIFSGYYFAKLRIEPLLADMLLGSVLAPFYNYLLPFLIDFFAFLGLYYLVPNAPVKFSSAIFGAMLSAFLFSVAKIGFALYIQFSTYSAVYGTIAAVPILLFWIYLGWIVVLYGSECSYQAQYMPRTGQVWKRSVLSVGDGSLLLAMQALTLIARAFMRGQPLPNEQELSEKLGCSSVVLKPSLNALERAKIVLRGDSREMPLTLLRSPERISLHEVKEALFKGRDAVNFPEEMARVFNSFTGGRDQRAVSLAEIVATGDN